ncbi:hypothetical protein KSS87_009327 [Heliosperma pusillum]|nr:hypothetical protein KSS87_009327 [Heliosperma pusillum]
MALGQKAGGMALPSLMKFLRQNNIPKPLQTPAPLPSLRRTFSLYDQINLIDNVPEDQLRFQEFDNSGFKVNGIKYEGSLLCVGNLLMSWKPKNFSEITPERTADFPVSFLSYEPGAIYVLVTIFMRLGTCGYGLEILIIGCGRNIEPVPSELRKYVRSTGMKLEAVDSRNAASTYNILNEEGRIVAAALLPYGVSS